jgi:hypothetical protein
VKAKLADQVRQMKTEFNKVVEVRRKMQEKLKIMYNQNKENRHQYREKNQSSTTFDSLSTRSSTSALTTSNGSRINISRNEAVSIKSGTSSGENFFKESAQMLQISQNL